MLDEFSSRFGIFYLFYKLFSGFGFIELLFLVGLGLYIFLSFKKEKMPAEKMMAVLFRRLFPIVVLLFILLSIISFS
jgi:hypothetical protein